MQKEVYEFISKQSSDPIVERKTCAVSGEPFVIFQSDKDFYEKISPTFNGKKYQIPTPTLCPEERQRRRLAFRNEAKLYRRKCDFSGKDIVSLYAPNSPYTVYDQKIWMSDQWDPTKYGIAFDPNLSFFAQFNSLLTKVPRLSLNNEANENSEYNNYTDHCKDTYLCFFSNEVENNYYINGSYKIKDSMDIGRSEDMQQCYACFNGGNLAKSYFCMDCDNSSDLSHCTNCMNCQSCFGCVNLQNKQYYIFNKEYTKEEYYLKLSELIKNDPTYIQTELQKLKDVFPIKYGHIDSCQQCLGDFLYGCKDCIGCFEI